MAEKPAWLEDYKPSYQQRLYLAQFPVEEGWHLPRDMCYCSLDLYPDADAA